MGRLLTPSESFSGDSREGSRQPSATHTLDEAFTRPHSQSSAQQQTRQDKSTNPIHDQAVKSSQSKPLQLNEPLTEGESESAEGLDLVPYQLALFLTLFASILEGSFLSYVKSSAGSTETLSEMLYFIRIFSDLAGRPFTFLYIPPALEKVDGTYTYSCPFCISFRSIGTLSHVTAETVLSACVRNP